MKDGLIILLAGAMLCGAQGWLWLATEVSRHMPAASSVAPITSRTVPQ